MTLFLSVIIDSCALSAEICCRKEKVEMCLRKLSVCLNDIAEKSADLEKEVKTFDTMISQFIADKQNQITIEQVKDACSENYFFHFIMIFLEISGLVFANWLFNRHLSPNRIPRRESLPLTTQSSEG